MVKYILVSGGVISGIGKGIIASSTGLLLKSLGLRVTAVKIDPYLNIDAGLMNPIEHGEVFVMDDGGEVDLDLGNYERFLDITLTRDNNITTGKVYLSVIEKERRGDYLGKTVQVIPHVTDEVQNIVQSVSKVPVDESGEEPDVCIIELGGTVGDIESAPFIEAMRQFQFRVGPENLCLLHVSLIPAVGDVAELKTKPTQASVRELRGLGLTPDLIMCRSKVPLDDSVKNKISMFCHVPTEHVVSVHDCRSIYEVPLVLEKQGYLKLLQKRLKLESRVQSSLMFENWKVLSEKFSRLYDEVVIVLVGKYTGLHDSYLSVSKSLEHAALAVNRKLVLRWVEASDLEDDTRSQDASKYHIAWQTLCSANGVIIPGGFGTRGTEGKVAAAAWARTNKIPFLGICLGLQIAVIEFARNVLGMDAKDATSAEFNPTASNPIIINMPEISLTQLGGTMRLGRRVTLFKTDKSVTRKLYGNVSEVYERHRHRFEVNTEYLQRLEDAGMHFVGHDKDAERMEILELDDHPYYVATQFHPEYKTRPLRPAPVFLGLLLAASGQLNAYLKGDLKL